MIQAVAATVFFVFQTREAAMSFSAGQNRSDATGTSSSESQGFSSSQSQDIAKSISESLSSGQSSSTQSIAFEDLFKQLYGGASGAADKAMLGAGDLTKAAQQLFTGGSTFLQGLGGDAGTAYLNSRLKDDSVLNEQIDLLRQDSAKLFNEDLNPAITSRSVAGGTLGGGRQGVAQGMALDAVGESFSKGAATLRAQDLASKDQAAAQVASNSLSAANTGLGALPGLLDLTERGNNAELGIYSSLASILGGPTVLGQSQSTNTATSNAQSLSEALSRSYGEQTASSQSRNRATSRAWNMAGEFQLA